MNTTIEIPTKPKRRFLPDDLKIESWKDVEKYFIDLRDREVNSVNDLENWLLDWSETDAVFEEDSAWRYIKMTCNTADQQLVDAYNYYINNIYPHLSPFINELNKKFIASPFLQNLDAKKYHIFIRKVKKEVTLFRPENIALMVESQNESQKYGAIIAAQTIEHDGKELTMQQATSLLKSNNRELREQVWKKINERKSEDTKQLQDLFSKLINIRHQIALNAGYKNYRDYKFDDLGRFDYNVNDCLSFHAAIEHEIVPLLNKIDEERKQKLGLDALMPWDMDVDTSGGQPLKPFSNSADLITKTINCFNKVRPYYAECIEVMNEMNHLDLDSRKGKAPGGYNYPLYEIGVPFIFMNAVGTHRDLVTMVHEGGHAIHSFLSRNLFLTEFKNIPSEVAELASMSMELISMEHWEEFFADANDLKRARKEQLEKVLRTLPWISMIDLFQHWLYENPANTAEQRNEKWVELVNRFYSKQINWQQHEDVKNRFWQNQLHLYEVPFYYIEYGFAQLGAIAVWRNYATNGEKALDQYQNALALGYTKSIPQLYETAGIDFKFTQAYVKELVDFVKNKMNKI